jgi:uncharacterized protein (DUF2267 family)
MTTDLANYYDTVLKEGKLRTPIHARRWSTAVLKTLGVNLDRRTKKKLARALPDELANDLTRLFWLAHFRNTNLSRHEFQYMVSRRSGNSDADFARYPISAVFHGLKALIDHDTSDAVAKTLAPDVRALWEAA